MAVGPGQTNLVDNNFETPLSCCLKTLNVISHYCSRSSASTRPSSKVLHQVSTVVNVKLIGFIIVCCCCVLVFSAIWFRSWSRCSQSGPGRCCCLVGENACMAWTSMVRRTWRQVHASMTAGVGRWPCKGDGPCLEWKSRVKKRELGFARELDLWG